MTTVYLRLAGLRVWGSPVSHLARGALTSHMWWSLPAVSSGDSNSCPHTCTARAFTHCATSSPQITLSLWHSSDSPILLAFRAQQHWQLAVSGPMCLLWWRHTPCIFLWPPGHPFSVSCSNSLSPITFQCLSFQSLAPASSLLLLYLFFNLTHVCDLYTSLLCLYPSSS